MDDIANKIQSLLEKVKRAFPPPEVKDDYVRKHFDGYSLVEPEDRLPSMLSAYLKVALEEFSPDNKVSEFIAYALSPDKDWKEKSDWWCRRLRVLKNEQVNIIFEYLSLVESDPRFGSIFFQIKRAQPRLKELWKMTQSNHDSAPDARL